VLQGADAEILALEISAALHLYQISDGLIAAGVVMAANAAAGHQKD